MPNIYHYTPEYIHEIEGRVYSDQPLPEGKTVIHTSALGDLWAKPIPWPVGDFTGFYPLGDRPRDFQRGISDEHYGSSAVQFQGITAGMQIHTYSAPAPGTYRLAVVYYAWSQHIFPWRYGDSARLCLDYYTAVPNSWTTDGSINYAYTAIAVHDCSSGQLFWIAASHYDSRGAAAFNELPIWWPEAKKAIALSYFGGARYTSPLPGSCLASGEVWNDWRYYGFSISRAQLQGIANEVNSRFEANFSTNPDDYLLLMFNTGPEMNTAEGQHGHMSSRVTGIRVYTQTDDEVK